MMKRTALALLAAGAATAQIVSSGGAPAQAAPGASPQAALPGKGPAQHPFLYAGVNIAFVLYLKMQPARRRLNNIQHFLKPWNSLERRVFREMRGHIYFFKFGV